MSAARKVVLVSESGYSPWHEALLRELVTRPIDLFCAVGEECEKFEDAVDWLCVELFPDSDRTVVTSSHPGETEAEVIAFAKQLFKEFGEEVEVVRV